MARIVGLVSGLATPAGVYDFWLGGHNHLEADRVAAVKLTEAAPELPLQAVENRRFLRRAVRFLAAQAGIEQFLDIGAGLPTQGSVHEIAQAVSRGARVVYVDYDEMVVARARALTADPNVAAIRADVREPLAILAHPVTRDLIDFTRPLAVLMIAVLHFISDADDPARVVAVLRDAVAAGSYLAISHVTSDVHGDSAERASAVYTKFMPDATLRSRSGIARLFDGFELLDPGLVQVPFWRPDDPPPADADKLWILGAVGRKPGLTSG